MLEDRVIFEYVDVIQSYSMFFNFYRLDLHSKHCGALANL